MRFTRTVAILAGLALLTVLPAAAQGFDLWAQGDCSGTSASVTITDVEYRCSTDRLVVDGSWSVTGGDAVYLEYFIDGVRYQFETLSGSSGTWSFIEDGLAEGNYTFRVDAYPKVGTTVCLQHGDNASQGFAVDCQPDAQITGCSLEPDYKGICYGTCTGSVSGGTPAYSFTWCVRDQYGDDCEPTAGPTVRTFSRSPTLSCRCGYAGIYDTVVFEVEDSMGKTDEATTLCGVPM